MAQQIVNGDIKWEDVRNEIDLVPGDDSDLEESERDEDRDGDRAASKRRKLKHDGKKGKKEEIDAELEAALAEQKRLQLLLADGRKVGAGGKSVTFYVNDELAKQVKEANAILRQRLEETATNKGLSSNALLATIGLENTSSEEDRAKLFREFQGRRGTESASGKPKVTARGLLNLLIIMIGLYSVCWNSNAADMWENYRFVELLLRKYTIVSVAAWDWAVRSLSRLGEWRKGTLFSELCHAGGNQSWSSSHGNNNRTSQSTPEGEVCNYGENCRFRHSCPACPGKKDHHSNTVVVGSGGVVWDPGEGVACPAEVGQKDKTLSSTLQRNKKHRSPQYVNGVASTSFLLVVPPAPELLFFPVFPPPAIVLHNQRTVVPLCQLQVRVTYLTCLSAPKYGGFPFSLPLFLLLFQLFLLLFCPHLFVWSQP
eukprot:g7081.t1